MIYLTEEMFSTGKPVSQGEVNIWMKKYAPVAVIDRVAKLNMITEVQVVDGRIVLGHSETGAHHVLEAVKDDVPISRAALALIDSTNDMFIELRLHEECKLVHERSTDTHTAFVFPPGEYIRGIREEQTVGGWQRVSD